MDKKQENNTETISKTKMVSFSEVDENGVFREAYGYIEQRKNDDADEYFCKKIEEISEIIKKR